MKKMFMATAAIVLISVIAWALDDTPENRSKEADRYLAVTPPKEIFQDMADQMAMNLPVERRQEFKDMLTKHLDIPALAKAMKEAMVKHFTTDELKALADFYGSPIGKSAMKKFGAYMAEVMPAIQAEMIKARANQITPGIYDIYLGMSIKEISKIYPVKEAEDLKIALYRKFGFGDPDKEERINKKLRRTYYEITERLPENVKNIRLSTIQDVIYEIAVYYEPEYTKKISWEVFTYDAIQKYGQPTVINAVLTLNEYSFKWSDGITELVIRKNGTLNKEKTVFSVESYHVFYTHVPTREAVSVKEKQLDETETAPGIQKPPF